MGLQSDRWPARVQFLQALLDLRLVVQARLAILVVLFDCLGELVFQYHIQLRYFRLGTDLLLRRIASASHQ